jgi:phosphatidate phosphatase PAH1
MDDGPIPGLSARPFRHSSSNLIRSTGGPRHRARDRFLRPDDPQVLVAKFAYGMVDKDLKDEEVDVFVRRKCDGDWEKLGTTTTTREDTHHPAVDGVDDRGGQVYFTIPDGARLDLGLHQVRFVVAGDLSQTEALVEVVNPGTPLFVSDVDGTLTSSENVEFLKVLEGKIPDTHPGAAEAFRILVAKGYRAMYLTARPELLVPRTRAFLRAHGFPAGVVHTSPATFGAGMGASAAEFKKEELRMLAALGLKPTFGFGNMPSDSDAYALAGIDPSRRFFYRIAGTYEGRRIESYEELHEGFRALSSP